MISLYRSPSHKSNEFEEFLANLEKHISNIFSGHSNFVLLISDFNVKSRNWPNHDITANGRSTAEFSTDTIQDKAMDNGAYLYLREYVKLHGPNFY